MQREVVFVGGVRMAIGKFGGSLKNLPPTELAATVVRELLTQTGVSGEHVGRVVFGNVLATEPRDMYFAGWRRLMEALRRCACAHCY